MERTAGPLNVALVVAEESPDPIAGEGFCHVRELQHLRHHEEHDEATIRIDSDIALNLRNNGYGRVGTDVCAADLEPKAANNTSGV